MSAGRSWPEDSSPVYVSQNWVDSTRPPKVSVQQVSTADGDWGGQDSSEGWRTQVWLSGEVLGYRDASEMVSNGAMESKWWTIMMESVLQESAFARRDLGSVVYLPAAFIVFVLVGALHTRASCSGDRSVTQPASFLNRHQVRKRRVRIGSHSSWHQRGSCVPAFTITARGRSIGEDLQLGRRKIGFGSRHTRHWIGSLRLGEIRLEG